MNNFCSANARRTLAITLCLLFLLAPAAFAQDSPGRVHVVVAGDTLAALAARYDISLADLMAANDIADPNLIFVGQRLKIPGNTPAAVVSTTTQTYHLQPGDSAFSIARRFGIPLDQLLAANGVSNPQRIRLETEIRLPLLDPATLPLPFLAVTHSPGIIQGQTGIVHVTLTERTAPSGGYGNTTLTFFYRDKTRQGYRYWAFIPTGALASPGPRTLSLRAGEAQIERTVPIWAGIYETQYIVLPPAKGELLQPQRTQSEVERLNEVWGGVSDRRLWSGAFLFPIVQGFIRTSPFGSRRSYNDGPVSSYHAGSDWSAPEGTPLWAPAGGVVVLAEPLDVRGGAVIIDHGLGVYSNFWHLSRIDVEPGQRVAPGQIIGLVGSTGLSTGAHLHWEVRVNGIAVDPMQWADVNFPFVPLPVAR